MRSFNTVAGTVNIFTIVNYTARRAIYDGSV